MCIYKSPKMSMLDLTDALTLTERVISFWPHVAAELKPIVAALINNGDLTESNVADIFRQTTREEARVQLFKALDRKQVYGEFLQSLTAAGIERDFCPHIVIPNRYQPALTIDKAFTYHISAEVKLFVTLHDKTFSPILQIQQKPVDAKKGTAPRKLHTWQLAFAFFPHLAEYNGENAAVLVTLDDYDHQIRARCIKDISLQELERAFEEMVDEAGGRPKFLLLPSKDNYLPTMFAGLALKTRMALVESPEVYGPLVVQQAVFDFRHRILDYLQLRNTCTYQNVVQDVIKVLNREYQAKQLPELPKAINLSRDQLKVFNALALDVAIHESNCLRFVSNLGPEQSKLYGGDKVLDLTNQLQVDEIYRSQQNTLNRHLLPLRSVIGPHNFFDGVMLSVDSSLERGVEAAKTTLPTLMQPPPAPEEVACLPLSLIDELTPMLQADYIGRVNLHLVHNEAPSVPIISMSKAEYQSIVKLSHHLLTVLDILEQLPAPTMPSYAEELVFARVSEDSYNKAVHDFMDIMGQYLHVTYLQLSRDDCFGCINEKASQKHHNCLLEPFKQRLAYLHQSMLRELSKPEEFAIFERLYFNLSKAPSAAKVLTLAQVYPVFVERCSNSPWLYDFMSYKPLQFYTNFSEYLEFISKQLK